MASWKMVNRFLDSFGESINLSYWPDESKEEQDTPHRINKWRKEPHVHEMRRAIMRVRSGRYSAAGAANLARIPVRTLYRYIDMSSDPGDPDFYLPEDMVRAQELAGPAESLGPQILEWTEEDFNFHMDDGFVIVEHLGVSKDTSRHA